MIAAEYHFIGIHALRAGTDYRQEITLFTEAEEVVDLTTAEVRIDIKDAAGVIIKTFSSTGATPTIALSDTQPNIVLADTADNNENLAPGTYNYDLRIKGADGQQIYTTGRFQIVPFITDVI